VDPNGIGIPIQRFLKNDVTFSRDRDEKIPIGIGFGFPLWDSPKLPNIASWQLLNQLGSEILLLFRFDDLLFPCTCVSDIFLCFHQGLYFEISAIPAIKPLCDGNEKFGRVDKMPPAIVQMWAKRS
jgi:hypothetical protein